MMTMVKVGIIIKKIVLRLTEFTDVCWDMTVDAVTNVGKNIDDDNGETIESITKKRTLIKPTKSVPGVKSVSDNGGCVQSQRGCL